MFTPGPAIIRTLQLCSIIMRNNCSQSFSPSKSNVPACVFCACFLLCELLLFSRCVSSELHLNHTNIKIMQIQREIMYTDNKIEQLSHEYITMAR